MKYKLLTASALIHNGKGKVFGAIVSSHTNGTLKLWDNPSANFDVLMDTFTFSAGSQVINFPPAEGEEAGIEYNTGLYADIGGVATITLLYSPRIDA